MASFKSHPIFSSILIALGLVVAGEAWCIYDRAVAAKKSAAVLSKKRSELVALQSVNPFPSDENKAAVEADLHRTEIALATMREELKGRGPTAEKMRNAKVPAEPTDIFFDLANFVEKTREKAQEAGVKIKADERFGFSSYASAGPDRELIPQVFRQRQVAQYLLEALFDAHPKELASLQREQPFTKAQEAAQAAGQAPAPHGTTGPDSDLFDIDPRISARVPGFVAASAFRLTFVGDTESLRTFLNKLATFELPLVVRSVEVEPSVASAAAGAQAASDSGSLGSLFGGVPPPATAEAAPSKPLVEKVLSKFTVTVELIDLVSATTTEATPTS
jgi:hypothetical protein